MQYTIVNLQGILQSTFGTRIDAEFYGQKYLDVDRIVNESGYKTLSSITSKIDVGYVGPMVSEYAENGVWLVQTQNVRDFFLDESDKTIINPTFHNQLNKSKVRKGDILIARSGSFGTASIYMEDADVNSSDVIIINALPQEVNQYYLVTFLNCAYGVNQILRFASGGLQGHVNLTILENLKVPILSNDIQESVEAIIIKGYSCRKEAAQIHQEAEALLLSELELADWQPIRQTESVRNFSDVWAAGRMDAEYFQPKYDEIVDAIKGYASGWDTLGNLVTMRKCVEVGSKEYLDEGIPFVRVSNITPFEITEEKYISDELYSQIALHQPQQGEILLSKDATPGIAHYLEGQPGRMIPSGGILRLKRKSDKVNDEYLTLTLNSMLTQEQVNRDVGGSVILHWRPDQVAGTLIPILPKTKQSEIQRMVVEATELRKESKRLLECATRAVEIAIEQDEAIAAAWLEDAVATADADESV